MRLDSLSKYIQLNMESIAQYKKIWNEKTLEDVQLSSFKAGKVVVVAETSFWIRQGYKVSHRQSQLERK